ncbi:hypothetical protein SAMN05216436_1115 [bacterium A37T11]|nr:hypothetical protein SAMN05216436_1115 [bacterium A37T11]
MFLKFRVKLRTNCRRTTYLLEKGNTTSLSLKDGFDMYFHLAICPFCSLYRKQSKMIQQAVWHMSKLPVGMVYRMDEQVKHEMNEEIQKRL